MSSHRGIAEFSAISLLFILFGIIYRRVLQSYRNFAVFTKKSTSQRCNILLNILYPTVKFLLQWHPIITSADGVPLH